MTGLDVGIANHVAGRWGELHRTHRWPAVGIVDYAARANGVRIGLVNLIKKGGRFSSW
jgi:hypothetical protein